MKALRNQFPLEILLPLIGLKRSTFFYHLADKMDKNAEIMQKIAEIYQENHGNYGYRRITLILRKIWTITRMMKQAVAKLDGAKPILHSDQGWQYQMTAFRKICQGNGITQSMSRKGNCLDYGAMESFFGRLKTECYFGKRFETFEQLKQTIHNYIHYYNNERIQVN